jgi:hypothetical protein
LKKRLQLVENKGKGCRKECEERQRGCNRLRAKELKKKRNTGGTEVGALRPTEGTLPGVLYGCETKGVARQGICKYVKTKDRQKDSV